MLIMRDSIDGVKPITSLIFQSSCIQNGMLARRHQDMNINVAGLQFS